MRKLSSNAAAYRGQLHVLIDSLIGWVRLHPIGVLRNFPALAEQQFIAHPAHGKPPGISHIAAMRSLNKRFNSIPKPFCNRGTVDIDLRSFCGGDVMRAWVRRCSPAC
ncbi:hypothetical protein [Ralstonia syzygii]|uniref:hypothetical protein n=1 Tax=Ralstonia syzygii TaxID=28097 RepID=UPI0018D001EC|nr:hypothetical protein [Ralstonia syzygii]